MENKETFKFERTIIGIAFLIHKLFSLLYKLSFRHTKLPPKQGTYKTEPVEQCLFIF